MKLLDRIVVVAGAGTVGRDAMELKQVGNGAACAITFAREGALVVCTDQSFEAARSTAQLIERESGRAVAMQMDVSNSAQVDEVVARVMTDHKRIDVLHNNVGIEILGDLLDVKDCDWDKVMAINLRGAMAAARAVVPGMRARRSGSIINMSSLAGIEWTPMQFLSYSTSKAALNHMTHVIGRQYAPDQVRCNSIVAGMLRTSHADALYPSAAAAVEGHQDREKRCPMGHQGSPWDVAKAALFLASDDSAYITGIQLVVDGGASL